jgi:hypothetical protein
MSTDPSVSPQTINQYIRDAIVELLLENEIYQLDTYGWIDADTYDPELVAANRLVRVALSSCRNGIPEPP